MAAILSAVIALPSEAATCHHFSVWHYPQPQRCGVARQGQIRTISDKLGQAQVRANSRKFLQTPEEPEIALPSLAQADLDGGGADEPTRARLLLRAALEAANAH